MAWLILSRTMIQNKERGIETPLKNMVALSRDHVTVAVLLVLSATYFLYARRLISSLIRVSISL